VFALLIFSFFPNFSFAQNGHLKNYPVENFGGDLFSQRPPGSYYIEHGGLRGLINDEAKRQLRNIADDYYRMLLEDGNLGQIEYNRRLRNIGGLHSDINRGGRWWERRWGESLPSTRNGAPRFKKIRLGIQKNFVDLKLFYVSNKFKFKLHEYNVTLSGRRDGWSFKFSPNIKFSTRDLLSRIEARLIFTYRNFRSNIGRVSLGVGWRRRQKFMVEISIELLTW
jgi:hypothetical protein